MAMISDEKRKILDDWFQVDAFITYIENRWKQGWKHVLGYSIPEDVNDLINELEEWRDEIEYKNRALGY